MWSEYQTKFSPVLKWQSNTGIFGDPITFDHLISDSHWTSDYSPLLQCKLWFQELRTNFFPGDTKHASSFLSSQEIGCDVIVDQSTLNENKAPSGKHQIFFLAFSFYNNLITVGDRIPNMFGIQMVEVCLVFIWSLVFKWSEPLRNRTKLLA